jgi:tripartite-type tricarboxylate transporter receptor subunit TctC
MKRILAAVLGMALVTSAYAAYPDRPIKMIVPFSAGSATDILGRVVAEKLSKELGVPIVVEAKPGAGTSIGAASVANSPADGYTILLGTNATFTLNRLLYKSLTYRPDDFSLIGATGKMPSFLLVSADKGYANLKQFLQAAKKAPEAVSYASSGVGSTGDMAGKMLSYVAGVRLLHIPYKDGPQGLTAAITGDVDGIFYTSMASMAQIKAGKVRPLAVTTKERTSDLPDVPTMAELGFSDFDVAGWTAIAVLKKTPEPIRKKLMAAMEKLHQDKDFTMRQREFGLIPQTDVGDQLEQFAKTDLAKMREMAEASHILPE